MRFLLRCMFFLSIVYGAILRQDGLLPELVAPVARALPGTPSAAGRQLVAGIGKACDREPSACLDGAAKLGRLLAVAGGGPSPSARRAGNRGAVAPPLPYMGQ